LILQHKADVTNLQLLRSKGILLTILQQAQMQHAAIDSTCTSNGCQAAAAAAAAAADETSDKPRNAGSSSSSHHIAVMAAAEEIQQIRLHACSSNSKLSAIPGI
jgi:hypothetical protein